MENGVIAVARRLDPVLRDHPAAILEYQETETAIIPQRRIEAAIGKRGTGLIDGEAGALFGADFLPKLLGHDFRQPLAGDALH